MLSNLLDKFDKEVSSTTHSEYYWWWIHERAFMQKKLTMSNVSNYVSSQNFDIYQLSTESIRPNEDREYVLALMLLANYTQLRQRDRMVMRNYLDFVKEFPDSKYNRWLSSYHKQYVDYFNKVDQTKVDGFTFVSDYTYIKRFEEILNLSRGKVIYLDMWATWCGPCRDEFEKSAKFWEFAKNNNVELMFLSLDDADLEDKWMEMIKYYNLRGLNLRASKSLFSDIHSRFGKDKVLSIPRYMILKDGNIVELNASRPSSNEQVFKQLQQYL